MSRRHPPAAPRAGARLSSLPARLALLALALGACGRDTPRPCALVVTLDTTRADAVGALGGPEGITPRLDALAAEGVVFTRARTVTPLTLPAHASMMTGLVPPRHGVRDNEVWSLSGAAETLAERARAAGYETAGFVAAPVLDRVFGIAQGFETWAQPDRATRASAAPGEVAYLPAEEVVDRALAWYQGRDRGRPFLCWVHLYDPHLPLAAPERFLRQARGNPYLAEVARADAGLGRLLDALAAGGDLERTSVVVLADHGEGNGDHGEATHGLFVYDSTLQVPFVVRPAPALGALVAPGTRDGRPASVVDLHPTVTGLLGLGRGAHPGAPALDGVDLLAPAASGRGVYFESYHGYLNWGWAPVTGWADGRAKYVHSTRSQLFRPDEDPGEADDRFAQAEPDELARFRARLARVAAGPALPAEEAAVDEELAREIAALGYVEGAAASELPGPLEDTGLPSPHGQVAELDRVARAGDLVRAGRDDEAAALYREALDRNPRNAVARGGLALALMRTGRHAEAAGELEELLATQAETAARHSSLGACLEVLGDDGRAAVHYRRALELDPGATDVMRSLARVLNRSGQAEESSRLLDRVQEQFLRDAQRGGVDEGN